MSLFLDLTRYAGAGIINSFFGYIIFYVSFVYYGLSSPIANALCFGVGLVLSILQLRIWVFPNSQVLSLYLLRFLPVFFVSYFVNLGVLVGLEILTGLPETLLQVLAMVSYSLVFFFLARRYLSAPRESV